MIPNIYASPELLKFLMIPNTKYHTAIKLGNNAYFHKPNLPLGTNLYLPPGAMYWSKKLFDKKLNGPDFTIPSPNLPFKLRPKQIPIFEKLIKIRHGLVEATTGLGKTVVIIALQSTIKQPTLILVHTKGMVSQFYDEFKKFLGDDYSVGRWNSDFKEMNKNVTITTFMSFTRNPKIFSEFKVLIIDEADAYFTPKSRKYICEHPAIRKFGFTGTTKVAEDEFIRKDETPCLHKFWGYKITVIDNKQKIEGIKYKYYFRKYLDENGLEYLPHTNWIEFRRQLDDDLNRKKEQFQFIENNVEDNDMCIVLFDRISDVMNFHLKWNKTNKNIMHGTLNKKERIESKTDFMKNKGVLFAQYQTTSRGVDYPECNKIFLMFPLKNETTLRQAIGRVVRFIPDKKAYIYDWSDEKLNFQFKKRIKTYRKYFPAPINEET